MNNPGFDEKDAFLLAEKIRLREKIPGPRIGDYVFLKNGSLHRFTHEWDESIQTAPAGNGSFYLGNGYASYSGGLDPAIPKDKLELIPYQEMNGRFWFFHHDIRAAHQGVNCEIKCRLYGENQ